MIRMWIVYPQPITKPTLDLAAWLPDLIGQEIIMKIKIVVHDAEEGGYWAEVPAIPGCASQGETMDELMVNLREAIEGCLSVSLA